MSRTPQRSPQRTPQAQDIAAPTSAATSAAMNLTGTQQKSNMAAAAAEVKKEVSEGASFIAVHGAVNPEETFIVYDVPFAPMDQKKSNKLRTRLGLPPETREVDPRKVAVIDKLIPPREWTEDGVRWVQHASPYTVARIDVVKLQKKLAARMAAECGQSTGVCPIRSRLYHECYTEIIRQVVADSLERGLLLLDVYNERLQAVNARRSLFESRSGYAFRLALKGEKDTDAMIRNIEQMKVQKVQLGEEEEKLKALCESSEANYKLKLMEDEKRYNDELNALKKEASHKKSHLESLTAPIKKQ